MSDALAAVFGVELAADPSDDPEALTGQVRAALADAAARGGSEAFAPAAARELARLAGAVGELADERPLTALWPGWRARRRAWRVVRAHLVVPRLGLPDWLRALLLLPAVAAGAWLISWMQPLAGAIFTWSPLALINLMLVALAERLAGWRFPPRLATLADLARRLRESPHDHPWTTGRIRLRVGEILGRLCPGA